MFSRREDTGLLSLRLSLSLSPSIHPPSGEAEGERCMPELRLMQVTMRHIKQPGSTQLRTWYCSSCWNAHFPRCWRLSVSPRLKFLVLHVLFVLPRPQGWLLISYLLQLHVPYTYFCPVSQTTSITTIYAWAQEYRMTISIFIRRKQVTNFVLLFILVYA